jgi:hypothetical protein
MKKVIGRYVIGFLCLLCWQPPAHATRVFTQSMTSPSPAQFDMASTSTGVFRITNTNTGANTGERIYQARFCLNSGTTFSSTTTAPAGWTRTSFSTTSVIFQATSWANAIALSGSLDFSVVMIIRTTTADVTDNLRDIRSYYSNTTTGPPFTTAGTVTHSAPTPWTDKSLVVTLTSSSLSVPQNCASAFTLTMQVTNKSTSNITGVVSVPKPPTLVTTGGATATTVSNPANLTLNAGTNGTFVWTYNTGPNAGTLTFSASAQDSTGTRTSRTITAAVITVTNTSCFTAAFPTAAPFFPNPSPDCVFSGDTVTFTMQVTNNSGVPLLNVQPSALTKGGTATIGTITGPAPASVATLTNGASTNFVWTAPITGNVFDTYTVLGNATATGGLVTANASSDTAANIDGFTVVAGPDTNAFSNNQEITLTVTNNGTGCNPAKSVSIPIPAGWTWSGDAYSLVTIGAGPVETWTVSGAGPVVFTAPVGQELPVNSSGDFTLTFTTPSVASTTVYTFSPTVTDTLPRTMTPSDTVTVNPFNSGSPSPNDTNPGTWREQFN